MKRKFWLLMTLILVVASILPACSDNNRMSKEEYLNRVEELITGEQGLKGYAEEISRERNSFDFSSSEYEKMSEIHKRRGDFFKAFSGIDNPPKGYDKLHESLREACTETAKAMDDYGSIFKELSVGKMNNDLFLENANSINDRLEKSIELIKSTVEKIRAV